MAKPTTVSLKLLIDEQGERVLFAEAGKEFVDFLFHILSLPMSTVIYKSCRKTRNGGAFNHASSSSSSTGGFVKGVVTYMVMDDLVVNPMSAITSITLLNKFNIKEVGSLQEKVVDVGMPEAVKLLKAALETDEVLTTVFLK
ncbi:hypothetical protein MIMGU_mgv11b024427mg [Erythranthe guttata]|uniref:DUF674 domain-containing protein n=1 Tax=Erythranthe guttata TaxID=4155 RepID=A0A022RB21_ERYGU|nr:hypothetical protein MIMGU_mgv11b024427mg [Erythranthe guttata]